MATSELSVLKEEDSALGQVETKTTFSKKDPIVFKFVLPVLCVLIVMLPVFYGGMLHFTQSFATTVICILGFWFGTVLFGKNGVSIYFLNRDSFRFFECALVALCCGSLQMIPMPTIVTNLLFRNDIQTFFLQDSAFREISIDTTQTSSSLLWLFVVTVVFALIILVPIKRELLMIWLPKQRRQAKEKTLLYRACESDRFVDKLELAIIWAGVICSVIAIVHWASRTDSLFGLWANNEQWQIRQSRLHWPFVNPNHLSTLLVVSIMFVLSRFIRFLQISTISMGPEPSISTRLRLIRSPEKFGIHVAYLMSLLLMVATNLLTLSRAGNALMIGGMFVLYGIYVLLPVRQTPEINAPGRFANILPVVLRPFISPIGIILFIALVFIIMSGGGHQLVGERIIYGLKAGYDDMRQGLLKMTFAVFADSPLVGVGLGCWKAVVLKHMPINLAGITPEYAHNDLAQYVAEMGLIGLGILVSAIYVVIKSAKSIWAAELIPSERIQIAGAFLAAVLPVIHSLVDFPLHITALSLIVVIAFGIYFRTIARFE